MHDHCAKLLADRADSRKLSAQSSSLCLPARPTASSQSNEQALIQQLLQGIQAPHAFCEFGFDGHEFNCAQLITAGWSGLLIDGDARKVARAQSLFSKRVVVLHEYLFRENVYDIVARHYPQQTLGVLSIDVDGNDYWFLEALLPLQPALIIYEYNASLLHNSITVPYEAHFDRHAKHARSFTTALPCEH